MPKQEIVTVGFLQNQWFKNPEKIRRMYEKYPDRRQQLIKDFLFMGCLTGRRLETAFGEGVNQIIWEEVSTEIGGTPSSKFKADPEHIDSVIDKFKPNIVLTFGTIANEAIRKLENNMFRWHSSPHPAARHKNVAQELRDTAKWWRTQIEGG